jgi:Type I restriction-modification system methyltransferase subunit
MGNTQIVQKLWNLCDVLRDDGINYSDYVTELVLLLFIKMEYEQAQAEVKFDHKLPRAAAGRPARPVRPQPAQRLPADAAGSIQK